MSAEQTPVTTVSLEDSGVNTYENTTGEFSTVIDIRVPYGYRYEFPANHPVEMQVYAHESTTVSSGATDETQNLSNDLVNSPAVRDIPADGSETAISGQRDLVVWDSEEDAQVDVDAVDYDANTFDYSDTGAAQSTLEAWYLWGDSAQVEFRRYAPDEERYEKELIRSMRQFHMANTLSRDSYITFPESFTMMEKEHLKIAVKTDVDLSNWDVSASADASGSPGSIDTYGYSDIQIPVRKVPMKA